MLGDEPAYLKDMFDIHGGGLDLRFRTMRTKWRRLVRRLRFGGSLDAFRMGYRQG